MEKQQYVYNLKVKDLATKKTQHVSIIASSLEELNRICFQMFGSNYSKRCEFVSSRPVTKK